jgi:TldD protein
MIARKRGLSLGLARGLGAWCLAVAMVALPAMAQRPPAAAPAKGDEVARDTVLRAMVDEIQRTRQLTIAPGAPLYFANYMFAKGDSFLVSASHGALLRKFEGDMRVPTVNVRVGNYQSDDTNFVASGVYQGTRFQAERFPLDDNYQAMRRNWWLLTDMQYKGSAQSINLKRASMQNLRVVSDLPDFTRHEPTRLILPVSIPAFDTQRWERRVRDLSRRFSGHSQLLESQVQFGFSRGTEYVVNSEGSIVRRPYAVGFLRAVASTIGEDGAPRWDNLEILGAREEDFPDDDTLAAEIDGLIQRLSASVNAPVAENYRGPVLFEGQAGPQLVAQLIGRQLWIPRKPVMIPNRPVPWPRMELEGRVGVNIVSEKISVRDDPTLKQHEGHDLIGHTVVDLESVVPKPITVIQDGKLLELFRTRTPSMQDEPTNGRARIPGVFGGNRGAPTNLIVDVKDAVAEPSLKQQLIERATAANLPYGLLIRKLDFPTTAPADELRRIFGTQAATAGKVRVSLPLAVYRVYPDGKEEFVSGLNFRDLELRVLRDLIAAGDQQHLFQYLENGALFAQMGVGNYVAEVSVICPSLLLEEVELEPITRDLPSPPIVAPPVLASQ